MSVGDIYKEVIQGGDREENIMREREASPRLYGICSSHYCRSFIFLVTYFFLSASPTFRVERLRKSLPLEAIMLSAQYQRMEVAAHRWVTSLVATRTNDLPVIFAHSFYRQFLNLTRRIFDGKVIFFFQRRFCITVFCFVLITCALIWFLYFIAIFFRTWILSFSGNALHLCANEIYRRNNSHEMPRPRMLLGAEKYNQRLLGSTEEKLRERERGFLRRLIRFGPRAIIKPPFIIDDCLFGRIVSFPE